MTISCKRGEHPDERQRVYRLRAAAYRRHYANIPADAFRDELDEAVLPDGRPCSVTLLAEQGGTAVGTARLVLARHPGYPGLTGDCQRLMAFDLDQLIRVAGFDPGHAVVGEVGKLAVARDCDVPSVKRCVYARVGDEASQLGMDVLLAVMPPFVARSGCEGGIHFIRWEQAHLRRATLEDMRFLLRYHDYFLPALGKQGLEIDPERLERAGNFAALEALASDCPDGAFLWFARTEEWVRTVKRLRPSAATPSPTSSPLTEPSGARETLSLTRRIVS
jgi:hypothetical protein